MNGDRPREGQDAQKKGTAARGRVGHLGLSGVEVMHEGGRDGRVRPLSIQPEETLEHMTQEVDGGIERAGRPLAYQRRSA